jgi:hypothetical protein
MVFARQHGKPNMIGENGAQEQSQDPAAKPKWMRIAHETFMKKPRTADCPWCGAFSDVAAVVYFDVNYGPHGDWRIMSSEASFQAYRDVAGDPYFHQLQTVSWPPEANRNNAPSSSQSAGPSSGGSAPPDQSAPSDQSGPSDPSGPPGP